MIDPSTRSNRHLPTMLTAYGPYCVSDKDKPIYLDFIGGNNTVILGHKKFNFTCTPNFSGKSYLEDAVSSSLSKYTNTKHFRYFKNGSDAVSCAIRLARSILGKDSSVCFLGYGGSNDQYAWTINKNGIQPQNTFQFPEGEIIDRVKPDILVYESRFKHVADRIVASVKICDHLKSGINGLWESTSDIDLYGKSLANGYPVSVMTGNDDIMLSINDIYYSTTFGGDNVGLEAIMFTLDQYDREKWLELKEYADKVLPEWLPLDGDYIKKFLDKAILFNGLWQLMTCHTRDDIDQLASACDDCL